MLSNFCDWCDVHERACMLNASVSAHVSGHLMYKRVRPMNWRVYINWIDLLLFFSQYSLISLSWSNSMRFYDHTRLSLLAWRNSAEVIIRGMLYWHSCSVYRSDGVSYDQQNDTESLSISSKSLKQAGATQWQSVGCYAVFIMIWIMLYDQQTNTVVKGTHYIGIPHPLYLSRCWVNSGLW